MSTPTVAVVAGPGGLVGSGEEVPPPQAVNTTTRLSRPIHRSLRSERNERMRHDLLVVAQGIWECCESLESAEQPEQAGQHPLPVALFLQYKRQAPFCP